MLDNAERILYTSNNDKNKWINANIFAGYLSKKKITIAIDYYMMLAEISQGKR